MSSLHGFTFKKGLKEMFSQIRRSVGRVPRVRKRKSELGPFTACYFIFFFKEPVAMQRTLQKMANRGDKVIAVYACRMKDKFVKYWENFSNVNYLLHVSIGLDPRYKMKYLKFFFEQAYEASEAVTKIALVESTFNRL